MEKEKQLALSRMAKETKLSTALLWKLETNWIVPTLPTFSKICRVQEPNPSSKTSVANVSPLFGEHH